MKKLYVLMIFAGGIFFGITHLELFANNTYVDEEQLLALLDEGTVVISNGQIYNLAYMHEFYQDAQSDINSEIYLIIDPYTEKVREYVLQSLDGRILLFSAMGEDPTYNHTVDEYARLFRIYRGKEIHYVLECFDHNEFVLFSHGTD